MKSVEIQLVDSQAHLLPEKALWFPRESTLVVADLHWGKIDHFRKAGIPIPTGGNVRNAELLVQLMNTFKPRRLLLLGDLFHSVYNAEWETFGQLRRAFPECSFDLIIGNHDILSIHQYERHDLILHPDGLKVGSLMFTHEPMEEVPSGLFNLAGHLHPGVRLIGTGRQSVTLPCFYVRSNQLIMPAFGSFTGLAIVRPKTGDQIFVIANGKVLPVNEW